jgi:hypothetical protein
MNDDLPKMIFTLLGVDSTDEEIDKALRLINAWPCPKCGERSIDQLVWQPDDETVVCSSCGNRYPP